VLTSLFFHDVQSMFIRTKKTPTGKTAVQIVEGHRIGKRVVQNVIRHVGQAETEDELEELKKLAEVVMRELIFNGGQDTCLYLNSDKTP